MKITFTKPYTVKGHRDGLSTDKNTDTHYTEGQTVEVPDPSHFFKRGVAVPAEEAAAAKKK